MQTHTFNNDFRDICKEIQNENKTIEEWREIESDDMFQKGNYTGGFDATEDQFTFSVYLDSTEYWFQVSLKDIPKIIAGDINEVNTEQANK